MDDDATRERWRLRGLPYLVNGHNQSQWIKALFLTVVDMARDIHVAARGISWVSLPIDQRRLVYVDIVRRIAINMGPGQPVEPRHWDDAVDILLARDQEISALGDAVAGDGRCDPESVWQPGASRRR